MLQLRFYLRLVFRLFRRNKMQKEEKFKHPADVRAYMARIKREYRAKHQKKKAMEATVSGHTSIAKQPREESLND